MEGGNCELWKEWVGKNVYIRLKRGREYSGKVMGISPCKYNGDHFIFLKDKYGFDVFLIDSEIALIQEEAVPNGK